MEIVQLASAVESILFAADRPVTLDQLQAIFGETVPSKADLQFAVETVQERYRSDDYGFEVREAQGGYQFCTKQKNADWVRKFLEAKPFRLGRSTLETLAIIAYRQPITRAEIDQVRGIDSSHLLRALMEKGLVKMTGKSDAPGRPVQYGTTPKFLDLCGLASPGDLPPLSELKELAGDTPSQAPSLEDDLGKFIDSQEALEDRAKDLEEGLTAIDEMIQSAKRPTDEVYASPLHAEVAEANTQAVESFQTFSRTWRKPKAARKQELESPAPDGQITPPAPLDAAPAPAESSSEETPSSPVTDEPLSQ